MPSIPISAPRNPPRSDDDPGRDEPDVEVGEADDDEARPGPPVVPPVQLVRPGPEAEAERGAVERVEVPADEVACRVAAGRGPRGEGEGREHADRPASG